MKQDPYRFHAKIYDRFYEPAAKRLREVGLKAFPPRENLSILDVGCGTGTQLALYQRGGCKLFGIDLSPAMLAIARQRLGETADLRLEDASQMTFDSRTFDLVTMVLTLHEMPARLRSAVLQECKRVVKTDGRIMLMDYHFGPHPFPMGWVWKILVTLMEISAGREHYANYRDFITRQGLKTLVLEQHYTLEKRFIFDSGVAAIYLLEP
ncbi:MAG TPA: methyltransferase domain-containing protein [Candidatus Acidoferrales bacterium]|nr:methyltransferase domain-containing protein [Candidatus Acidoferrales bacterium]